MVQVVYLGILRNAPGEALQLVSARDVSFAAWLHQSTISQYLTFTAKEYAERTKPSFEMEAAEISAKGIPLMAYSFARNAGICGVAITQPDYPQVAAKGLLRLITDKFMSKYDRSAYENLKWPPPPIGMLASQDDYFLPFPELKEHFDKYQDPEGVDALLKIQSDLNDTQKVLVKVMEDVLGRGEKLDALVAKSEVLSSSAKMFGTQARKQNSCCVVM